MAEVAVIAKQDFSGGIDATSSPLRVQPNQVLRMSNLLLDITGALYSRDGAVTIDTAQFGTTSVLTLYDLAKSDGSLHKLAVRRSPSGQFLDRRGGVTPWPQLGTFATLYDLPSMVTLRDMAIIAAGYEPIKYFNGTTFGALTALVDEVVPPGAKHLAVHLGSLWAWNTAAVTNATDGPSSLRCSAVNNPNSWPLENQTFISNDDGQQGQGLGVFTIADTGISPQGVLIAFKDFSTYVITGLFANVNFSVEKVKTDLGCIAPRSIQFLTSKGIIRLTHRGFAITDGQGDTLLSEPIRPYLFPQRVTADIPAITWAQLSRSTATQVQNPPLYLCACPFGAGPELTRVFVYDLLRQAWTILTFPVAFATLDAQFDPNVAPYVLAGEQGGGRVQRLFAGDEQDDGTAVSWHVRLAPITGRDATTRTYFRRALVKAIGMHAGQSVLARGVLGPAAQAQGPGVRFSASSVPTMLSPTAGIEGEIAATLNYDIGRSGEVLYLEFEGSGPIVIREVSVHARPKGASRPMRL
jgi:hypothetical protein